MAKSDARKGMRFGLLRRVLDAATGARLCFGDPVSSGDRTVIPVSRVRTMGGWGYGAGADGDGGGGGGRLEATPVGFIEITPAGTRFQRIREGDVLGRLLKATAAASTLAAGVQGARRAQVHKKRARLRPKRARRLLKAGRR